MIKLAYKTISPDGEVTYFLTDGVKNKVKSYLTEVSTDKIEKGITHPTIKTLDDVISLAGDASTVVVVIPVMMYRQLEKIAQ